MALAANEVWAVGFVRDTTTSAIITTLTTTGAAFWGGFLRDADGRLVVAYV